jgi:hypothetical protein
MRIIFKCKLKKYDERVRTVITLAPVRAQWRALADTVIIIIYLTAVGL